MRISTVVQLSFLFISGYISAELGIDAKGYIVGLLIGTAASSMYYIIRSKE